MTEKEYYDQIEVLRDKIKNNDLDDVESQLNEMYKYKPVRLIWFLTKAEFYNKTNHNEKVWAALDNRIYYGSENPSINETMDFHANWLSQIQSRYASQRMRNISYVVKNEKYTDERLNLLSSKYFNGEFDNEIDALKELMMQYLINNEMMIHNVIRFKLCHNGYLDENRKAWFYNLPNYGYLEERLLAGNQEFILIQDENNIKECKILISILKYFNCKIFVIENPVEISANTAAECLSLSISSMIELDNLVTIKSYYTDNKVNNIDAIIKYICKNKTQRNYAVLLSRASTMFELSKSTLLNKNIDCLCDVDTETSIERMCFGWVGDYLSYISDIYNLNAAEELNAEPEVDFSIIIPARNSAGTLQYTLKTCLDQTFSGTYEIVISDNSESGKTEVYNLCKDLNSPKIRYLRTPRQLSLSRSFEYAHLKSRGRFILSIGSDDGIMRWSLSILDKILKAYPNDKIIQWERGYYAWHSFPESDRDKLIIPGKYDINNINLYYRDNIDYFANAIKNKDFIYSLPLLYINSGCKRDYLKTIYEKTGRLWDGCNQDIYMGVVNAAINSQILNVKLPLTVAGMSGNSIGYITCLSEKNDAQKKIELSINMGSNAGRHAISGSVKEIPIGPGETYSFYVNILRCIQTGILPENWKTDLLDFKQIYINNFSEMSRSDEKMDFYICNAKQQAKKRGEEFYNWFMTALYPVLCKPCYIEKKSDNEKASGFAEGENNSGGYVINAYKSGVENIAEAVELFDRNLYWYKSE